MSDWQPARGCVGARLALGDDEGGLHVLVHRHEGVRAWLMTCLDAGIDMFELEAQEEAAARIEALVRLENVLEERLAATRRVLARMNTKRGKAPRRGAA